LCCMQKACYQKSSCSAMRYWRLPISKHYFRSFMFIESSLADTQHIFFCYAWALFKYIVKKWRKRVGGRNQDFFFLFIYVTNNMKKWVLKFLDSFTPHLCILGLKNVRNFDEKAEFLTTDPVSKSKINYQRKV
jgi:hypothetical protein